MSGPDPGDSADDDPGDDGPDRRDAPSSDGTETPDETHTSDDATHPSDGSPPDDDSPPSSDDSPPDDEPSTRTDADGAGALDAAPATNGGPGDDSATRRGGEPAGDEITIEDDGLLRWFLKSEDGTVVFARDVLSSVAIVAVIGLLLFGLSGIWPPLVAVESGSMEPNMERGDLIFVVADDRFVGDGPADGTGVVTLESGQENDHEKFGQPGDVVVFSPDGQEHRTPIIHRAHFYVERGENWVATQADPAYLNGNDCDDLRDCPAPHDGFITKGDANHNYDQVGTNPKSTVVKPEWVSGKAMFRIPYLGHVRLTFDAIFGSTAAPSIVSASSTGAGSTATSASVLGAAGVAATGVTAAAAYTRRRY